MTRKTGKPMGRPCFVPGVTRVKFQTVMNPDVLDRLEETRQRIGISRSRAIEQAVEQWLGQRR